MATVYRCALVPRPINVGGRKVSLLRPPSQYSVPFQRASLPGHHFAYPTARGPARSSFSRLRAKSNGRSQDTIDVELNEAADESGSGSRAAEGVVGGGADAAAESDGVGAPRTAETGKSTAAGIRKVFFYVLAAVEFAMRGNLLWTPVAMILSFAVSKLFPKFNPVRPAKAPKRVEAKHSFGSEGRVVDLMATDSESPVWMPVFLDTWWPVIERMVSRNVISTLQQILDREVPPAISLQVNQFYLGRTPPQCTNIQAYYRPNDGGMEIFELDVVIDSKDMSIIISGKAPVVGSLKITMTDFDVAGRVQLWTLPSERMVLIGFKTRPQLKIGMQLNVRAPFPSKDAHTHIYTHTHTHRHTHTDTHTHIYTHTHTLIFTHTRTWLQYERLSV